MTMLRPITTPATALAAAALFGIAVPRAQAVFTYQSSTSATRLTDNLSTVGGSRFEGRFNSFLGTAIASDLFITAEHIGGAVGDTITFAPGTANAGTYTTTAVFDDPDTDLSVHQIAGTFSEFAPLYMGGAETGQTFNVFGRGTQVGNSFSLDTQPKGFQWGAGDGVESYGSDTITGVTLLDSAKPNDQFLFFDFSAQAGDAGFSAGDSGGGLFINDGGTWKLAGINFGVTSPFQLDANGNTTTGTEPDGNPFNATLYDIGGLWVGPEDDPTFFPDLPADTPGDSFATRIANRVDWIRSVPEPTTLALLVPALGGAVIRRRRA